MPGKMTSITTHNTETTAFPVPFNKLFEITRIEINNLANEDIRVRGWDKFTDTDGVAHDSTASPVPLFDYPVASQDGIVVDCQDKAKKVMGILVLKANCGSGTLSATVEVYVGGKYPF